MAEALYELYVNGQVFQVSLKTLLGLQIRALAAVDPIYDLIIEGQASESDHVLGEDESVSLERGPVHIYTRPPTSMGAY
jgi:hypothetical protein